ncbi:MAG: c-type cytochrome [Candidatus Nanopelagicales bacterium]
MATRSGTLRITKYRKHPAAIFVALLVGLIVTSGVYSVGATAANQISKSNLDAAAIMNDPASIDAGKRLFATGCATCHGLNAQGASDGPTLIGVGAASVHFQVSTGRMPMAAPGAQVMRKKPVYTEEQTLQLAAYVASLSPGPAIPNASQLNWAGADLAKGGELFRANCAQCHSFSGRGGALTEGKYAPTLMLATPQQIYEAMITGPQAMPIFNDQTLNPEEKQAVLAYIEYLKDSPNPGGLELGRYGPVTEGLFLWTVGIGALLMVAIWIGVKAK